MPEDIADVTFTSGDDTLTFVQKLQENIDNIESFEAEFGYLKTLFSLFKSETKPEFSDIGATLDDLSGSKLFADFPEALLEYFIDTIADEISDEDYKEMVLSIKVNIPNIVSYEDELNFLDIAQNTFDGEITDYSAIGETLDDLITSKLVGSIVNDLFANAFDETVDNYVGDYLEVLEAIKANIQKYR